MSMPAATETTTHGSKNDREIVDAKVIVTCPGRNFVTLKITTRSGVYGLGDATLNGRELAVASYLQDHVVPNLIGRDAGRIEDMWQFLHRGAYWRRGPVTMTAIAARTRPKAANSLRPTGIFSINFNSASPGGSVTQNE